MKVWYVMGSSGFTSDSWVKLFPNERSAREEYDSYAAQLKKDINDDSVWNDEAYVTQHKDRLWISYDAGADMDNDFYLSIGSQEIELTTQQKIR